jgi:hypothetical protein
VFCFSLCYDCFPFVNERQLCLGLPKNAKKYSTP